MTKIVGLTGGIGSGKTTVAKMFETLGISVYIADVEAKKITNKTSTLAQIEEKFGSNVIKDNELDRVAISKIVFSDPEKLEQLNAIIHPLVATHFKDWLKQHENEPFIIKEVAILFETKSHLQCDFVITVVAPEKTRIQRVVARDSIEESEIRNRISNQWTDERRIVVSDFVIENETIEKTKKIVNDIYKKILQSI